MDADAQTAFDIRGQGLDALGQGFALADQTLQQLLAGGIELVAHALQGVQSTVHLDANAVRQLLGRLGIHGFRREGRVFGGLRQHQVHLAQALAQHAGEGRQIAHGSELVLHVGDAAAEQIAGDAIQTVQTPGPGIALVVDVLLHQHQRPGPGSAPSPLPDGCPAPPCGSA